MIFHSHNFSTNPKQCSPSCDPLLGPLRENGWIFLAINRGGIAFCWIMFPFWNYRDFLLLSFLLCCCPAAVRIVAQAGQLKILDTVSKKPPASSYASSEFLRWAQKIALFQSRASQCKIFWSRVAWNVHRTSFRLLRFLRRTALVVEVFLRLCKNSVISSSPIWSSRVDNTLQSICAIRVGRYEEHQVRQLCCSEICGVRLFAPKFWTKVVCSWPGCNWPGCKLSVFESHVLGAVQPATGREVCCKNGEASKSLVFTACIVGAQQLDDYVLKADGESCGSIGKFGVFLCQIHKICISCLFLQLFIFARLLSSEAHWSAKSEMEDIVQRNAVYCLSGSHWLYQGWRIDTFQHLSINYSNRIKSTK